MEAMNPIWESLQNSLPMIIPRKSVPTLTGGLISRGYLANLDSKGLGPTSKMRIGKSICYEKNDFIAWMKNWHNS